jgi:hypothetical protein
MEAMKPRLEPAEPTKEDFEILCYTWPGRDWRRDPLYPIGHSIGADRRDADLMYEAAWYSASIHKYVGVLPRGVAWSHARYYYLRWLATGEAPPTCVPV